MKMRKVILAGVTALALVVTPATSAVALQFGSGIVFDPTNYRQNLVTAIRNVQQVNNQIRQLDHEIRMLANQANDLRSLPYSVQAEIRSKMAEMEALIIKANSISKSVTEMEDLLRIHFPDKYDGLTNSESIMKAREQWKMTEAANKDAILIQAQVAKLVTEDQTTLDKLIAESQSASGNLQATQAENQLVALQIKYLLQNQLMMASQYRAEALDRAETKAARERSEAQFTRFLGTNRSGYTRN